MRSSEATGHLTTEQLFREHAGFVARFLTRLGVPSEQLEDALQEVFLVVHRNGGYRPGLAKPTSYLAGIAIRAAARHRHKLHVTRKRHSDAPIEQLSSDLADPSRALQVRQDLARLQHALQRLPQDLCTTLLLVEVEGESCVSVAAGLGRPVGTIYWRLHQARKELKAALRSVDAGRDPARDASVEHEEPMQPARSFAMLLGLDPFARSEASRLLQLAREHTSTGSTLEQRLPRHQQLVQSGAELPAWAAECAQVATSWLTLLGTGPIAAGVTASAAIAVALLLATQPAPAEPPRAMAGPVATANTARVAKPRPPAPSAAQVQSASEAASSVQRTQPKMMRPQAAVTRSPSASIDRRSGRAAVATAQAQPAQAQPEPQPQPQAPAPEQPQPTRAQGATASDAELAEMRQITRAERLLSIDPKRALALTRAMHTGFPAGYFREERDYLEVLALRELGRTREMREKAAAFLGAYPQGLYSSRVRKAAVSDGD